MLQKSTVHGIFLGLMLVACSTEPTLLGGAPDGDPLVPGLSVLYFDGKLRNVSQVPDGNRLAGRKGQPGKPVLILDHQFGEDQVFDSGKNREVAVQLKGYIRFEMAGDYRFQALSNDGMELRIDGVSVLADPDVHTDRLSAIATFPVKEAGYQPLMVKYFQRKGSAALRLFWKPPGQADFEVIPAAAYWHSPDQKSS